MTVRWNEHREMTITNCARCGKTHENLSFQRFKGNPIKDDDGTVWDWWASCPVTGDPILQCDIEPATPAPGAAS